VLHPDEVAADKTLALFGRAAARDLVDVAALAERYTLPQLCELAVASDLIPPRCRGFAAGCRACR
jgi:predicted nucleotidyltransferase component of viral defense system